MQGGTIKVGRLLRELYSGPGERLQQSLRDFGGKSKQMTQEMELVPSSIADLQIDWTWEGWERNQKGGGLSDGLYHLARTLEKDMMGVHCWAAGSGKEWSKVPIIFNLEMFNRQWMNDEWWSSREKSGPLIHMRGSERMHWERSFVMRWAEKSARQGPWDLHAYPFWMCLQPHDGNNWWSQDVRRNAWLCWLLEK